ncbi:MAG: winged helix-turn-helix domain-containing protein [Patescibacteria group bacterium]|nr:MAG: winged helix-turn-helix domain-containing protein [Patescibacteria group bacterium]
MIAKLFGSTARVKLLKLFLLNPENSYYVREIARLLDLQLNAVRRELENLEVLGLVVGDVPEEGEGQVSKTEKKYYRANVNFVLFKEIKELILKAQILCEPEFTEKLRKIGEVKLLLLSGLFLNDPEAPVDLLIVGEFKPNKLAALLRELEQELVSEVRYTVMSEADFKYRRQVTDVFLFSVIEGNKIIVIDEMNYLNP